MGILSLFERRSSVDARHPRDPALAEMFGLGQQSIAGVRVTPDTALQEAAVTACVKVLSEDIAKLPLIVYRRSPNGAKRRETGHRLYDILHDAPNRNQTSFEWRETCQVSLLLRGDAVCEIISTGGRGVAELMPISRDRLRIFKGPDGRRAYEYTPDDGPKRILLQSEVLHVPGMSFDGISGLNPIAYHRETIGNALGAKEFGARFLANGANTSIVVKHPKSLSPQAIENLRESIAKKQGGLRNANKPWVLEEGMEVEKLTISPADAQYLESRKFSRSEIASIFRVPAHKINDLDRATFSNIEQQSIDYVVDSLMPWLTRWEQAINRWLLTEAERRSGHFVSFLVNGLLRGDAKARSEYYKARFEIGTLSQNDIRRLEDEDPITGGDQYFVPLNFRRHDEPVPPKEEKGQREERNAD